MWQKDRVLDKSWTLATKQELSLADTTASAAVTYPSWWPKPPSNGRRGFVSPSEKITSTVRIGAAFDLLSERGSF
ncbi:hypothetical protein J6590_060051 [Homalodisca vitripennis]|nr:hypothetical protein J6590_060051 [Homalodisca vitripennis]